MVRDFFLSQSKKPSHVITADEVQARHLTLSRRYPTWLYIWLPYPLLFWPIEDSRDSSQIGRRHIVNSIYSWSSFTVGLSNVIPWILSRIYYPRIAMKDCGVACSQEGKKSNDAADLRHDCEYIWLAGQNYSITLTSRLFPPLSSTIFRL